MNELFDPAPGLPAEPDAHPPAPMPASAYLDGLNPEQRQAAEALDGPLLVLAGAGTGKTRVLTTRLAHILATGRARPGQVLAVTFTNKAAREMIGRVERLIGRSAAGLWLGTFHAIAARILRRHAELAGLKPDFTILDTDDQVRLLKQIIQAADIDEKRWPARTLSVIIQRWKDRGLTVDRVAGADGADYANGRAPTLYAAYQERLRTVNAADFGDLLLHNLTLFTRHGDVLADFQQRFRYLLVDEYQDTNVAQYLWLRLLAQTHHSICCVGDDDQSIYGWRGAEVGNILRFEQDFPGAQVVRLERNYRSTGHILAAASGLIAHNAGRLGKTLWTEGEDGEKVRISESWDGDEEARAVGDAIEALQHDGESLDRIAILVRAGFQTRAFEERFLAIGLPYRVIGGLRFYERQEIRDAVAYIRVMVRPDDDLAFERIVNLPKRSLGEASLRPVHQLARADGISLYRAAERLIETDELRPQAPDRTEPAGRAVPRLARRPRRDAPRRHRGQDARRVRLHRDVAEGPLARRPRPARESEGAGRRAHRVRGPRRLPRPREPGDGSRRRRRGRDGQHHDAPRRQGPGVRQRVPARMGGRGCSRTSSRSTNPAQPAWRRSAAWPMSGSPARGAARTSSSRPTGTDTASG